MNLKTTPIEKLMSGHEPVTCSSSTSLKDVITLMSENNFGAMVIMDNNKVAGIFTERDLLHLKEKLGEAKTLNSPISDFMTKDVKTVTSNATIHQCLVTMRIGKFRHVVVTNEDQKLLAVLSIRDALYFLCDEVVYKNVI